MEHQLPIDFGPEYPNIGLGDDWFDQDFMQLVQLYICSPNVPIWIFTLADFFESFANFDSPVNGVLNNSKIVVILCSIWTQLRKKKAAVIGNISDLLFDPEHMRKATVPHRLINLNKHVWVFDLPNFEYDNSVLRAVVCDESWTVMKKVWAALCVKKTAVDIGIISTRLDGTWNPNIQGKKALFDPTCEGPAVLHSHPIFQAIGTAFS